MNITREITVILISALPLSELRGGIPLAIWQFGFSPVKALALGVFGNLLPVLPLLIGLERTSGYLSRRFYQFNRFFNWIFERTRNRHRDHFHYWGDLALFLFVAVPLPLTGAWSGALAAFVFGFPLKHALWSIALGVIAAGLIVTAAAFFGENIFGLISNYGK